MGQDGLKFDLIDFWVMLMQMAVNSSVCSIDSFDEFDIC